MRKVIFQNMITLDGFFAGPQGQIDWHEVDEEFNEYAIGVLDQIDTLLFGRVTYELMANYWSTDMALSDDPIVAGKMNALDKVVFSRSLDQAAWSHSRLVKGDAVEEVGRLKKLSGKDMAIFGSADLAKALIASDLVDEYHIFINPIVLGSGLPLFKEMKKPLKLKLVDSKIFKNGLVLLVYDPK